METLDKTQTGFELPLAICSRKLFKTCAKGGKEHPAAC